MGVRVVVREGEHIGAALRRLRRLASQAGVSAYRWFPGYGMRRWRPGYETPGQVRRRKKYKAMIYRRIMDTRRRYELGLM
jgi:ribosomal protein S21